MVKLQVSVILGQHPGIKVLVLREDWWSIILLAINFYREGPLQDRRDQQAHRALDEGQFVFGQIWVVYISFFFIHIFLTAIAEGGPWASDCAWQNEWTFSEPEPVIGPWVYTEAVYLFTFSQLTCLAVLGCFPRQKWNSGVPNFGQKRKKTRFFLQTNQFSILVNL